jgi:hypothetical protein
MTPAAQQLQQGSRRLAPGLAPALVRLRGVAFALLAHAARLRRHRCSERLDLADEVFRRGAEQLLGDGRFVGRRARNRIAQRRARLPNDSVVRLLLTGARLRSVQGSNDGLAVASSHQKLQG